MSSTSPASVLFSSDGYELAVVQSTAIPAGTRAILSAGTDGTNSRFIMVDSSGNQIVVGAGTAGTPVGGVVTIQGSPSGTPIPISGSITATNPSVSNTGASPPSQATYIGGSVTTSAPTYTTGQMNALSLTTTGLLRVDGSGVTQPVSGTVTANAGTGNFNNASVSTTGSAPPVSATYLGGSVTTAAPTYTNGQMSGLSLTTGGALRVDASAATITISGTVTANIGTSGALALDATLTGGTATTRITDGTNTATVKAASTAPVAADKALVVAISPNTPALSVITDKAGTGTVTSVAAATSTTSLLASNANRILATIYNESNKILYAKLGATASLTSYTIQIFPNSYWELPASYTGAIDGIWASGATGSARITELSP